MVGPVQRDREGDLPDALARNIQGLLLLDGAAADGRLERDLDMALLQQVVMDRRENLGLVAVGEGQRQFQLAEKVLFDGQIGGGFAGQRFRGDALDRKLPGGGPIGHGHGDGRLAVVAGEDGGVPIAGFLGPECGQQRGAGLVQFRGQRFRLPLVPLALAAQGDVVHFSRLVDDQRPGFGARRPCGSGASDVPTKFAVSNSTSRLDRE